MQTALKVFGWAAIVSGTLAFAGAGGEAIILFGALWQIAYGIITVKYVAKIRKEQAIG